MPGNRSLKSVARQAIGAPCQEELNFLAVEKCIRSHREVDVYESRLLQIVANLSFSETALMRNYVFVLVQESLSMLSRFDVFV